MKLSFAVLLVSAVAAFTPTNGSAALFFLFDRTTVVPNDRVAIRTGGTPADFILSRRARPLGQPVRLYLVPNDIARTVHSRLDPRLEFVGSLVPDRRGRGILTFSVPPLDSDTYAVAYWCPACATYSRGHTFFVQEAAEFREPYRSRARLRIAWTDQCPVTTPNGKRPPKTPAGPGWHGNGLLWAGLPRDGAMVIPPERVEADGSLFNKLGWSTTPAGSAPSISGQRLDGPAAPLRVIATYFGSSSNSPRPSWATPVLFSTPGCWRITARVRDLTLTYVVSVVIR